jgi:cell division protein FtsB
MQKRPSVASEQPHATRVSQPQQRLHPSKRAQAQKRAVRAKLLESAIVLSANAILATFAIVGLAKLIPYYQNQSSKLETLQTEVQETKARVQQLKENYQRDQDPKSFTRVAREEGNLIPKNQQPVILVQPAGTGPRQKPNGNSPQPQATQSPTTAPTP